MSSASNPKIGLDNVVIARLTSDSENGVTYDTPIPIKGAVQASVNPNSDVAVDYADNGAFFVANNRGNTEISLEFTNIAPDVLALMLGQARANGVTVETPQDQSPYFAMGFRVWIGGTDDNGNKIYQNFWFAKGKFSVPETGGTTKKESMDFQHISLSAQFVSTLYSPNGDGVGVICTHCRTDIDTAASVISNWFNAPVIATSIASNTISVASAAVATGVLTITLSATSATTIADATINANNITVLDSEGAVVPGTFSNGTKNSTSPSVKYTLEDPTDTVATVVIGAGLKDVANISVVPKVVTIE